MKRIYFVAVTSDVSHFEEVIGYATNEQAKEGLKLLFESYKEYVISMGFKDEMAETLEDDWFTINYNDGSYYHAQVKSGVMFDEGEKPTTLKSYKVTITKKVLAYGEDDAVAVAKGEEDYDYDDEEKITTKLVG